MKKIFLFATALCMTLCAKAQVMFADEEGNLYGNGDYMVLQAEEDPDWGEVMCPAPSLVNQGKTAVNVRLDVDVKYIAEGTLLADCFSGRCLNYVTAGMHSTTTKSIKAGGTLATAIEWNCWSDDADDYVQDYCIVKYTLYVGGVKDKSVTVEYTYADPAADAITSATASACTSQKGTFTLDGRKATPGTRGLIIRDGKKYAVK